MREAIRRPGHKGVEGVLGVERDVVGAGPVLGSRWDCPSGALRCGRGCDPIDTALRGLSVARQLLRPGVVNLYVEAELDLFA
jgi:hypothetical protein